MRFYFSVFALLLFSAPSLIQAQQCIGFDGLSGSYGATSPSQFGDEFYNLNNISLGSTGFEDSGGNVSNTATFWAGTNLFSGAFTAANGVFIKTNPEANLIISVAAASEITFDFIDWNSTMNMAVNGEPLAVVNNLADLPTAIAPGVTMTLNTTNVGAGIVGTVTLTGYITEVIVGGDNAGFDDICFIATTPICQITSLSATASACDANGEFSVDLDFNFAEEGSNGFTVTGNGNNYGTFDYNQLPITINSLTGDNSTVYEFVVQDVDHPNCTDIVTLGTVNCPVCGISNVTTSQYECVNSSTYSLVIDFDYENVSSAGFDIHLNGNYLEYWTYAELPIMLELPATGGLTHDLVFCDENSTVCCSNVTTVDQLDCTPSCAISNLQATPSACVGLTGEFSVDLNFSHENAGTEFTVSGNGVTYGTYQYSQLPITIGALTGDGTTTYEFVVTDTGDPNCTATTTAGPVNCPLPCEITGLQASSLLCTSDTTVSVLINFQSENTASNFNLYDASGNLLGTYAYSALPVTYTDFIVEPGQTTGTITVCDTDDANCCSSVVFDTPDCTPVVCAISNVVATPSVCDGTTGVFDVSLNFDYENTGTSFTVTGNGVTYGTFFYVELPVLIESLAGDGTTTYEFVVTDTNNPNCTDFTTVGPINCPLPCEIGGLNVETNQCTSDSTLSITVDFETNSTNATFNMHDGNNNFLGMYGYSQLPVTNSNFPVTAGQTTGVIVVCDTNDPNCCSSITFDTPDCSPAVCEIANFSLSPSACDSSGNFMVVLDFNYANTSTQFSVTGNGVSYGSFNYTELPIEVGPFTGDGSTVLEFEVSDTGNNNCTAVEVMTSIDCTMSVCELGSLVIDPSQCNSDTTYSAFVNFDYANVGDNGFDVFIEGTFIGFYEYAELPLTINNMPSTTETVQTMLICDIDEPNCCTEVNFEPLNCTPMDCELGDMEISLAPCDSLGSFTIDLSFASSNTGSTFTVTGNGSDYGTFNYSDLPVTVGPFDGDGMSVYELIITDNDHPNCVLDGSFTAIDCNMDCELFTPVADPLQCTSDSTFSVFVDFDYANVSGGTFTVFDGTEPVGTYNYADLPLEIQDYPSQGEVTLTMIICDDTDPDCCTQTSFEGLECGNTCNIFEVWAEPTSCDQGLFLVEIDMEYQNPGQLGFQVFGNGNNYGNYSYDDLPITIGAFPGDGSTVYEFVVSDLTNQDCVNFTTLTAIDCLDECVITDLEAEALDCVDGEFMVALSFNHNNESEEGYVVSGNGVVYGEFVYGETAVVGPFAGDGETVLEFVVSDLLNDNCVATVEMVSEECSTDAVYDLFEGQVAIRYNFVGEQLVINFETPFTEDSVINIYDATGQLQGEVKIAAGEYEHLVDVSNLGSGMYICQLRNSEGALNYTFVRAR